MSASLEAAGGSPLCSMFFNQWSNGICHLLQEYPDRMLATFSILPSPKVSETVVEVSRVEGRQGSKDSLADIVLFIYLLTIFDSRTMRYSPSISSLRTAT